MFKILQVDCCSDCMYLLNKEMTLPIFSMHAMQTMTQKTSPVNFLESTGAKTFTIPTFNF